MPPANGKGAQMIANVYQFSVGWLRFAVVVLALAVTFACQKAEAPSQDVDRKTEIPADTPHQREVAVPSVDTSAVPETPALAGKPKQEGGSTMGLEITSSAFDDQGTIPKQYTADGQDVSPPLSWSGVPEGSQSLAMICDDPDAPVGTWVHWVIWNIPGEETGLKEAISPRERELANGAAQGTNDFRKIGYGGPAPPRGPAHRYFFKLYALDTSLNLGPGAKKDELERAMQGHVLAEAELVGRYGR